MKRKRHTEEQIIAILKEHEAGMKTADLCRKSWSTTAAANAWRSFPTFRSQVCGSLENSIGC